MLTNEQKAGINRIRENTEESKTERNLIQKALGVEEKQLKHLEARYECALEALEVIQKVTKDTHKLLEIRISDLVSTVLAAIWEDAYGFDIELKSRKDSTECFLWFNKNGRRTHPLRAEGGGTCDVADWGCMLSWFSLNPTRPTFLMDEKFKFVNGRLLQERTSEMLKIITEELNVQILMSSNQEDIIACADKVFNLKLINDVTEITEETVTVEDEEQTKPKEKKVERLERSV